MSFTVELILTSASWDIKLKVASVCSHVERVDVKAVGNDILGKED